LLSYKGRKIDWDNINQRNRGTFVVEADPRFPGGYYITTKRPPHVYLAGDRRDIEALIENAAAALGGYTPVLVATSAEAEWFREARDRLLASILGQLETDMQPIPAAQARFLSEILYRTLFNRVAVDPRVNEIKFRSPRLPDEVTTVKAYVSSLQNKPSRLVQGASVDTQV